MGALLAGVFCGVLLKPGKRRSVTRVEEQESKTTYGAVGRSAFLFGIGSDMFANHLVSAADLAV